MRNYPQNQFGDFSYYTGRQKPQARRREPEENPPQYAARVERKTDAQLGSHFERAALATTKNKEPMTNYEQPALPYYVVPVLYVPQKVLSNEDISPSTAFRQEQGGRNFGTYVRQTKQQKQAMLEDFEIPRVTCKYHNNHRDFFPECESASGCTGHEMEYEDDDEDYETFYNSEQTMSGASVEEEVEEEEEEEAADTNDDDVEDRYRTKPVREELYGGHREEYPRAYQLQRGLAGAYQLGGNFNKPEYRYEYGTYDCPPERLPRKMQPRNAEVYSKPLYCNSGGYYYYPDQNREYATPQRQAGYYAKTQYPKYQERRENYHPDQSEARYPTQDYIAEATTNIYNSLKPKSYYVLKQNNTEKEPIRQTTSKTPEQTRKPTCEEILLSYMQEKEISLKPVDVCELPQPPSSISKCSSNEDLEEEKVVPCKESDPERIEIIKDKVAKNQISLENITQNEVDAPKNTSVAANITPDACCLQDIPGTDKSKTSFSHTHSSTSYASSLSARRPSFIPLPTPSAAPDLKNPEPKSDKPHKDKCQCYLSGPDTSLASFVRTLSLTVIAGKESADGSVLTGTGTKGKSLKKSQTSVEELLKPLKQSQTALEERLLYSTGAARSEPILETRSTQTVASTMGAKTISTQTDMVEKSAQPPPNNRDLSRVLGNKKDGGLNFSSLDIFRPLPKSRDYSPSTFFQKFRRPAKPYPVVDLKDKRPSLRGESLHKAVCSQYSSPFSPPCTPKSSTFGSKAKRGKKK